MQETDGPSPLKIPAGINYDCTGCGQCCLSWPVPLTADDCTQIDKLDPSALGLPPEQPLISVLNSSYPEHSGFTALLGKRTDGRCQFLSEDNRCRIQLSYGADMKPAMCRLFPYTFSETPDGVYASVSFVSSGALFNSGRPLAEQQDLLEEKWQLSKQLFPDARRAWSNIQVLDGFPLSWEEYMAHDARLLEMVSSSKPAQISRRLDACSRYLVSCLPQEAILERAPDLPVRPKMVDQLLLKRLFELYMTDNPFAANSGDLYAQAFLADLEKPPQTVRLGLSEQQSSISFNQLMCFHLGDLGAESEELLSRFVFNRIFGKLYFGAGFADFSVLAGVHHLFILLALIRLKIKLICLTEQRSSVDFLQIAEIVRTIERRLLEVNFTSESAKVFDLLLSSRQRIERVASLSS